MKRLIYLFVLPLAILFSCNDDKNFSPVDLTLTLSGVTEFDGKFYTTSGEDVTIKDLTVKAIDGKTTDVVNVIYYLDGMPLLGTPGFPFLGTIPTENLRPGGYSLGVAGNILQVDAPIQEFAVAYPLIIVEDADLLPQDAPELGIYSLSIRMSN